MIIVFFIIGLVIGSFLNVCIYRLPRNKSIIRPRSFCPYCRKPIKPYDNIPILSYILLGGKCRNCKKPISWRYPLVEFLSGIFFVLLFLKFGLSFSLLKFIIFLCLLIIATFTDLSHQIIPNVVSLPGIVVGLLFNISSLLDALIGTLIGAGILWVFRQAGLWVKKQEMMGWGDIKMAGMIGAFLGVSAGLLALFLGVCLGVLIWSLLILFKVKSRKEFIPFGAFLAFGSVIAVFFNQQIISWYLDIFRLP